MVGLSASRSRRDQQVDGAADRQTECGTTDHVERKVGSDVHPRKGHEPRKRGERPPPTARHGRQSDHRQGGGDRCVSGRETEVAFFNTSEQDVIDDDRWATPVDESLERLRRHPRGGAADPDRERESRPVARECENGRHRNGAEGSVLHGEPDHGKAGSREVVHGPERQDLGPGDRSSRERRRPDEGADAEGKTGKISCRLGHAAAYRAPPGSRSEDCQPRCSRV